MLKTVKVLREFPDGSRSIVGTLLEDKAEVYFQYDAGYISSGLNPSPFGLRWTPELQQIASKSLPGVFADSLPDGWGLLLMDRAFATCGISLSRITPLDRLSYMADRAMGSFIYEPEHEAGAKTHELELELEAMNEEALRLYEGETDTVMAQLTQTGTSGGSRPKANLYFDQDYSHCALKPFVGAKSAIVKFSARSTLLGLEEGKAEAIYMTMAKNARIDVPDFRLLKVGTAHLFTIERFDRIFNPTGLPKKRLMASAAGLLDADFRTPCLDYEMLIRLTTLLTRSSIQAQKVFRQAVFNLFGLNQDDHAKNWAYLQDEKGIWEFSPAFDLTFAPNGYNQHMTSFMGYGNKPPKSVIENLAHQAHIENPREVVETIVSSLSNFNSLAKDYDLRPPVVTMINRALNQAYQDNKDLLT